MKRHFFIVLLTILTAPAVLTAQEAYLESGKIILDMTVAAGMPAAAVTGTPKYAGSYSPSNSAWLINATDNLSAGSINALVYQKLEIAPQDLGTSGLGTGTMTMQWDAAFTACKSLNHNGIGWRLPTQRESQMMWIFRDAINDFSTTFSATTYWNSTEYTPTDVWPVNFDNGDTYFYNKTTNYRVRCVREL